MGFKKIQRTLECCLLWYRAEMVNKNGKILCMMCVHTEIYEYTYKPTHRENNVLPQEEEGIILFRFENILQ